VKVDFLLEVAADRGAHRLPNDGKDWLMVELCVVEPVQQVDGAGS
jgi:hypothetical protein